MAVDETYPARRALAVRNIERAKERVAGARANAGTAPAWSRRGGVWDETIEAERENLERAQAALYAIDPHATDAELGLPGPG